MFKLNAQLVMALTSVLITQSAYGRGEWESFRSATPEALFGEQAADTDVAENELYRVRASRINPTIKRLANHCQSLNHSLEMAQFQNMLLTNGIVVSGLYSKSTGQLVSVIAKGTIKDQGETVKKIMALNTEDCSIDSFQKDYFGYRRTQVERRRPSPSVPMDPAAPEPIYQGPTCDIGINLIKQHSSKGHVRVSCNDFGEAKIIVTANNQMICDKVSYVGTTATNQCEFTRDTMKPAVIKAQVFFKNQWFSAKRHISKAPSFNSPVRAMYMNTNTNFQAQAEEENIPFKGVSYQAEIHVTVQDNDILQEDPQNEIRVRLYNIKTKKVVAERQLSTNQTTTFILSGFYETPRFFGSPHWDDDKLLQPGVNQFAVIVNDAYADNDENPLILDTISIRVPQQ
jgi:hypothetical protein